MPKITKNAVRMFVALALFIIILLGLLTPRQRKEITVGSKNFTEQVILGEIMSILIEENTNLKVDRRLNLGGTLVCFTALRRGDLDIYADYTGTGLTVVLKKDVISDRDKVYQIVKDAYRKEFDLVWLKPFGFNNTYTLTMRREQAEKLGVSSISDLKPHIDLLLPGFDHEFMERPDGYPGLVKHYGFRFEKEPKEMDPGLMYKAISEKSVDVIDGFATDGRIPAFGLVILKDDKHFFPPYYAAPLIRAETLKRYPELKDVLNQLASRISDEMMRQMNYEVDEKGRKAEDVAGDFLKSNGLI